MLIFYDIKRIELKTYITINIDKLLLPKKKKRF